MEAALPQIDRIVIPSNPDNIHMVEPFVESVRARYQFGDDIYGNILISLTEAVNNAIIHGNGNDISKNVILTFEVLPQSRMLSFKIEDEGEGFDINELKDPTAPENIANATGRGIFLIKQLSDWVIFSDNGRIVEIQFKI